MQKTAQNSALLFAAILFKNSLFAAAFALQKAIFCAAKCPFSRLKNAAFACCKARLFRAEKGCFQGGETAFFALGNAVFGTHSAA